jgi:hypothetical protein
MIVVGGRWDYMLMRTLEVRIMYYMDVGVPLMPFYGVDAEGGKGGGRFMGRRAGSQDHCASSTVQRTMQVSL